MNIFTAVKYCCILHGRVCVMDIQVEKMCFSAHQLVWKVFNIRKSDFCNELHERQVNLYYCVSSYIINEISGEKDAIPYHKIIDNFYFF